MLPKKYQIIVMRHGESLWNKEKRWAGWSDVQLSQQGKKEAKICAQLIQKRFISSQSKMIFDQVYTSALKRAIQTAQIILNNLGPKYNNILLNKTWRLNEKHYGILQGKNKAQVTAKYGQEIVNKWRRSFDIPPPPVSLDDPRHPINNPFYKDLNKQDLLGSESLYNVLQRFEPLWENQLKKKIQSGKKIMIIAHGSSLRAFSAILSPQKKEKLKSMEIPNAMPIIYNLDKNFHLQSVEYLGDQSIIDKKIQSIKNQTIISKHQQ